jgi:hypothetical protein
MRNLILCCPRWQHAKLLKGKAITFIKVTRCPAAHHVLLLPDGNAARHTAYQYHHVALLLPLLSRLSSKPPHLIAVCWQLLLFYGSQATQLQCPNNCNAQKTATAVPAFVALFCRSSHLAAPCHQVLLSDGLPPSSFSVSHHPKIVKPLYCLPASSCVSVLQCRSSHLAAPCHQVLLSDLTLFIQRSQPPP